MFLRISLKEVLISLIYAVFIFIVLGTVIGLWNNILFFRMTEVTFLDYFILAVESILLGVLLGVKKGSCSAGAAGIGGTLGFLGAACPVCNKLLLLIFGGSFLMIYFEPIRHWVGLIGVCILLYLLNKKLWLNMGIKK
jgi:hypothetical protein